MQSIQFYYNEGSIDQKTKGNLLDGVLKKINSLFVPKAKLHDKEIKVSETLPFKKYV